jgi:hypothetical protein
VRSAGEASALLKRGAVEYHHVTEGVLGDD